MSFVPFVFALPGLVLKSIPHLQGNLARIRKMRAAERIALVDKVTFVRQVQRAQLR
jgi:hypothetical protein